MKYNYLNQMVDDIKDVLPDYKESFGIDESDEDFDLDDFKEYLQDELWVEDHVTGNASGSYTFNRWKAQEYVSENMDLLADACDEFGVTAEEVGQHILNSDWEWADVTIRCYLLPQAIEKAVG